MSGGGRSCEIPSSHASPEESLPPGCSDVDRAKRRSRGRSEFIAQRAGRSRMLTPSTAPACHPRLIPADSQNSTRTIREIRFPQENEKVAGVSCLSASGSEDNHPSDAPGRCGATAATPRACMYSELPPPAGIARRALTGAGLLFAYMAIMLCLAAVFAIALPASFNDLAPPWLALAVIALYAIEFLVPAFLLAAWQQERQLAQAPSGAIVLVEDGRQPTLLRMFVRTCLWVLGTACGLLGLLPILFSRRRIGFHDWICDTIVVDPRRGGQIHAICPRCGYSLRGLPSPQCPECGTAITPAAETVRKEPPDERP